MTNRAVNQIPITASLLLVTFEPAELSLTLRSHAELAAGNYEEPQLSIYEVRIPDREATEKPQPWNTIKLLLGSLAG